MSGSPARKTVACMLMASISILGSGSGNTAETNGNETVLQVWTDATGERAPTLVTDSDGTTRLNWAAASLDTYGRDVAGSVLLTPFASGSFQRGTLDGGTEVTNPTGTKSWFRVALTESNDRALLRAPVQLDQLQFGRAGPNHRVDFGDLALVHSTLSANTPLKGLRWQGSFESMRLSAAAGSISESWEALGNPDLRTQRLREAVSLKAETSVGAAAVVYATFQGHGDSGDLPEGYALAGSNRGHSTTAGANLVRGNLAIQAEAALSHATEEGSPAAAARAFVVDATWSHKAVTLRSGLHDFGPRFVSLSANALPGLRETYLNAAWRANGWSTWALDLRRTFDRATAAIDPAHLQVAPALTIGGRSDAATLQLNVMPPKLPGTTVTLVASQSRGQSLDGIRNDNSSASASVATTRGQWTTQATVQRGVSSADAAAVGASTLQGFSGSVGRTWGDETTAWSVRASLVGQYQSQRFATGPRSHVQSVGLRVATLHSDKGSAGVRFDLGSGRDTTGQPLTLRNFRLDLDRRLRPKLAMKVYAAWTDNYPDLAEIAYRERIVGIQFTYQF